jgi:hypothetical protein
MGQERYSAPNPMQAKKRERQSVFGGYNHGTGQMAISFADSGNSRTFIKHLEKVLYQYGGHSKIIIVLDNVKYHHAKRMKEWLARNPKFFFLHTV